MIRLGFEDLRSLGNDVIGKKRTGQKRTKDKKNDTRHKLDNDKTMKETRRDKRPKT